MAEQVSCEALTLCKAFFAVGPGTGKRLFTGMYTLVCLQVGALHESCATAGTRTDKRSLSTVHALVCYQDGRPRKGFATALPVTDKRPLPCMDPCMSF